MTEAMALVTIDFKQLFISIFIILVILKSLGTILEWLISKLGLETKFSRSNKEMIDKVSYHNTSIEELKKQDTLLEAKIDGLEAKIDKLTNSVTEVQIQSMRSEILDAAHRLSDTDFSEELYNNLFSIHARYEEILKANHLSNGQVDASFRYIEQRYQEQLQKGFK